MKGKGSRGENDDGRRGGEEADSKGEEDEGKRTRSLATQGEKLRGRD